MKVLDRSSFAKLLWEESVEDAHQPYSLENCILALSRTASPKFYSCFLQFVHV